MLSEVFYLNLDSIELQAERAIDPTLKTRAVAIISSSDWTSFFELSPVSQPVSTKIPAKTAAISGFIFILNTLVLNAVVGY